MGFIITLSVVGGRGGVGSLVMIWKSLIIITCVLLQSAIEKYGRFMASGWFVWNGAQEHAAHARLWDGKFN